MSSSGARFGQQPYYNSIYGNTVPQAPGSLGEGFSIPYGYHHDHNSQHAYYAPTVAPSSVASNDAADQYKGPLLGPVFEAYTVRTGLRLNAPPTRLTFRRRMPSPSPREYLYYVKMCHAVRRCRHRSADVS